MPNRSMEPRLISLGELIKSNKVIKIPDYQRDYSWRDEQTDQLWNDINNVISDNLDEYFIGATVGYYNNNELHIVDGQQRIFTIILLAHVACSALKQFGRDDIAKKIWNNYIGSESYKSDSFQQKMHLNINDNSFYDENILHNESLRMINKQIEIKKYRQSNQLMVSCIKSYFANIDELLKKYGDEESVIDHVISIMDTIESKIYCILIVVGNEADAFTLFETLNNRGIDLSTADLLKNYLFSRSGNDIDYVKNLWYKINRSIDSSILTRFFRHYWTSKYSKIRDKELYSAITKRFKTKEKIKPFMRELSSASELYESLITPSSDYWVKFGHDCRKYLRLIDLLNITQCLPVLIAAKQTTRDDLFSRILKAITIFQFRYTFICNKNPGVVEDLYHNISMDIRKMKDTLTIQRVTEPLRTLYPDDAEFSAYFERKIIKNSSIARYVLIEIENKKRKSTELIPNDDTKIVNLEHIAPIKASSEWKSAFVDVDYDDYIYRLGNLTLISSSFNRRMSNGQFPNKKQMYEKSEIVISNDICKYDSWGPREIETRQSELAKVAKLIWRIDQFTF